MFNRGLFTTSPTAITTFTSTSHRFLSGNFFGLSSRLRNTMAMQNRVLQYSPATFLRFSPYVTGEKFVNFTDIKFKRVKVTCTLKAGNSIFIRPFSSHADKSWSALRVRFPSASIGMNISHDKPSGIYSARYFSSDSIKNEKSFKGFHKFWKKKKSPNHKKSFEGKSGSKDTDMITSSDYSVQNVKKDMSVDSSSNSASKNKKKAKIPAKSKTSEEKPSLEVQKHKTPTPKNKNPTSLGSENKSKTNGASSVSAKKTNKREPTTKEVIQDTTTKQVDSKVTKNGAILKAQTSKKPAKKKAKPIKEAMKPAEAVIVNSKLNKDHKSMKPLYPPTGKSVVIVESLTKSKVIQGYLGDMYQVLPSYGHVRDLAARSGSVRPDDDFSMVWEVPSTAWTHLTSFKVALAGTQNLILASDPDREGEAIAWHIIEMLRQQDALHDNISIYRVVFNEITESSIKLALQNPRDIDSNMVHAYLARRALDYLIGFNISPLLWRKLPGCKSAGRVQSAALALISDREMEIDEFKPQEYWSVEVEFNKNGQNIPILSHLTHLNSKKLTQFSITSEKEAEDIKSKTSSSKFKILDSKKSTIRKMPPSPYITSTLQQDAANKLHFSAVYTMKLAQKLYEGVVLPDGRATGLITYTRTDGLHLSDQAANDIHALVKERYGESFASETPRKYFKKVKNAQEAHEAIRPTDIWKIPDNLVKILDEDSLKLYTLIWSRTVACQMEPSLTEILQIDIGDSEKSIVLRSSCSKIAFLGFRAAYEDQVNEGQDRTNSFFEVLDELKKGDPLSMQKVEPKQHHTQPPGRYSEASLVKKLEELGIGRPSTYASIIKVLQDRNYVTVKSRVLHPEFRGRMLSAFLSHHFTEVTDYSFTADMETELDNISAGLTVWKGLLSDYWTRFSEYCERASQVHIHQVEKMLEKTFEDSVFACLPNKDNRVCPSCREGTLMFKVSKVGAGYFIGCDKYPTCKYIAKTIYGDKEEDEPFERSSIEEPKVLGLNPGSEDKILMKCGPYGYYVQFGVDRKGYIAKRVSLNHVKTPGSVTLEDALELLRYPITLGAHPVDGKAVIIKIGKTGISVQHRGTNALIPKDMKPRDVTVEIALKLLSGKDATSRGRKRMDALKV